jgi:hypothetical protein
VAARLAVSGYGANQLIRTVSSALLEVKHYATHIERYVAITYQMTSKITIRTNGRQELEIRQ